MQNRNIVTKHHSVLFSESVELPISSLPHFLSFYFHSSYHQINQALVPRDSYLRGIKYYHPKKERLDINTKFGWCCGGLVVAAWCWSGLLLCSGLVCFRCRLPNPAHSQVLVFSKLGFLFSFFPSLLGYLESAKDSRNPIQTKEKRMG